jgi:16S rRNA (adenine1518-N6/adenine1519-N6)-dimethyltransferase
LSRRRLGQHFLTDPNILDRIVAALDPVAGETVLEIGPGRGTLTDALLRRGVRVVAIEKDRQLAQTLQRENVTVIAGDALEVRGPADTRSSAIFPTTSRHG